MKRSCIFMFKPSDEGYEKGPTVSPRPSAWRLHRRALANVREHLPWHLPLETMCGVTLNLQCDTVPKNWLQEPRRLRIANLIRPQYSSDEILD